jgi:hypothetical protein
MTLSPAALKWILRAFLLPLGGILLAFVPIALVAILFGGGLGDRV